MLLRGTLIAVAAGGLATSSYAAGGDLTDAAPAAGLFADVGAGGAYAFARDYVHINPIGVAFTDNATSGPVIRLREKRNHGSAFSGSASLGYQFANRLYIRATWRRRGDVHFHGLSDFTFAPDPTLRFDQDLRISGDAGFVGLGRVTRLSPKWFLDTSVEVGVARFDLSATQGANLATLLGPPGVFPNNTQNKFAYGAEVGLGYRLTNRLSAIVSASYDRYGAVQTGVNPPTNNAYLNPGEQLRASGLQSALGQVRLRYAF